VFTKLISVSTSKAVLDTAEYPAWIEPEEYEPVITIVTVPTVGVGV